ncbi:ParB/RepB/Spo0J family partition protein [Streptomyces sp. NPDC001552]|uniref:ParB/RepB/Spo0J family partition protein n=1 Tax=Streptomyces sp. NPDC001552 TaxID=3364587 RepID=UPI0036B70AB8
MTGTTAVHANIPMYLIDPAPAALRQHLDTISLQDLTEAVASAGERVTVRYVRNLHRYVLVMGEALYIEAKAAGATEIPAAVLNHSTLIHAWRLLEEVGRSLDGPGITPLEEGQLFRLLTDKGFTVQGIGCAVERTVPHINARIQLLDLCPAGIAALSDGRLPDKVARHLARIALGRQDGYLSAYLRGDFATDQEAEAVARQLVQAEREE